MAQCPEFIGKYKIDSIIAIGGMGTVYKALHPSLKRYVIIKKLTIRASAQTIRERFKREAQILLDLSSPYIVRMFDYFSEGRSDYIVLELVDGFSLDKVLEKQHKLSPQLALLILQDACYGLKAAHLKGIVHRDIKPGNILISKKAEVKLADFGIASSEKETVFEKNDEKAVKSKNTYSENEKKYVQKELTQSGVTLGTPAYMSPEQFEDSRTVDLRADIYSLGVMLYEMLSGKKPYEGDVSAENISKIKKGKYIPLNKAAKNIPSVALKLCKKMMNKKASRRFKTVDPIISKIKKYLSHYDTHEIRVSLARIICLPNEVKITPYSKKKNIPLRIVLSIFCAALISLAGFILWQLGFIHATLLRFWYTPVSIELEMPSTASVKADLPARAFFFVNDNDLIPEVSGTRRVFYAVKNQNQKKNKIYKIRNVYLKPGLYRIKIVEGPYVWWNSIEVTSEKKLIKLDYLKNAKRAVKLHYSVTDLATGKDLTSTSLIQILIGNTWVNLDSVDLSKLETGTVYKLYISNEAYRSEYYSLRIDWYQDELFINASLEKK